MATFMRVQADRFRATVNTLCDTILRLRILVCKHCEVKEKGIRGRVMRS